LEDLATMNGELNIGGARSGIGSSPWGPDDEIGRLNLMTAESRQAALTNIDPLRVFDLAVDFAIGMPSWSKAGDPTFAIWMTHTPHGTLVDNPMHVSEDQNQRVGYSGDSIAMYTHCGTHMDSLCHFANHGKIWNGFTEAEHLGSRHWLKCGAEKLPPIITRGVMLDVAGALGLDMLPDGYGISVADIRTTLDRQQTELREGDVVIVRTGRMKLWPDWEGTLINSPGITLEVAKYLVETGGAIVLAADNLSVEQAPSPNPDNWVPVHTYCLTEKGAPLIEFVNCEELAAERVYEFCFIGTPLKIRGATGTPLRPLAIPYLA
jgi:kynurenine formamidase